MGWERKHVGGSVGWVRSYVGSVEWARSYVESVVAGLVVQRRVTGLARVVGETELTGIGLLVVIEKIGAETIEMIEVIELIGLIEVIELIGSNGLIELVELVEFVEFVEVELVGWEAILECCHYHGDGQKREGFS